MMDLLCRQYSLELEALDKEIETLYQANATLLLDSLFASRELTLKRDLETFVSEILKTKEKKFKHDKLAYDNNTAYNWNFKY